MFETLESRRLMSAAPSGETSPAAESPAVVEETQPAAETQTASRSQFGFNHTYGKVRPKVVKSFTSPN
jgi:hypothetical protein